MNSNISSAVLAASTLVSLALLAGCSEHRARTALPTTVYVTDVTQASASRSRDFTATVRAHVESDVGFRTGGKVVRRAVEIGDRVKAGQVLAMLDAQDYDLGVAAADAQMRQAQAQAGLDASDQARFGRLTADGSIAAADHERQTYKSQASKARLDQSRRALQVSRNLASYATLVAPYDGVVTALHAEVGQVVAEGQPVVAVARDGDREIVADVPEGMMADIRALQARARPWAGQGAGIALELREVAPLASAQGRMFRVKYRQGRSGEQGLAAWPLGSTADLTLRYPAATATVLPVSALVNSGPDTVVWSVDANGEHLKPIVVRIVASDTDSVSVEGLPEHARIVTVGAQKLDAGMKVHAVERKADEAMKIARSAT